MDDPPIYFWKRPSREKHMRFWLLNRVMNPA